MSITKAKKSQSAPAKASNPDLVFAMGHGLSVAHLKKSNICHINQQSISELVRFDVSLIPGVHRQVGGYDIPYFTLDGKPSGFHRVRLDSYEVPFGAGKPLRYLQAKNSGVNVYFSPLVSPSWREIEGDTSIDLIITEGELKAACACAHGFPDIGIGGVSMWRRKQQARLRPQRTWHLPEAMLWGTSRCVRRSAHKGID